MERKLKKAVFINPRGANRCNQDLIMQDIYPCLKDDIALIGDDTEYVPHLGLLSIAAFLPQDVEACYLDEEYIPLDRVDSEIFGPDWDLVCLSAYNPQALRAYEIARRFRRMGITVVMGGLHVSGIPHEAEEFVDAVFIGEAEDTFPEFLSDFEQGAIKKVYRCTKPVDLTKVPPPRFHIISDFDMYNKVPLFATRGCPHNCDFCIFPVAYQKAFRHKTIEQLIGEVEMVKRLHSNPFISFSDENMLADRDFARQAARAMADLDVPWECYCDLGIAWDDELLELLRRSGCRLVQIGLETLDAENLKDVDPWKYEKVKSYPEAIKRIQNEGIPLMAMFIAGFDGDTPDVFSKLKKFIMKNRIQEIDFAVLTPMPGTPLFEKLDRQGRIISRNWNNYTWTRVNFEPRKMTAEQLEEGPLKLFRDFTRMAGKFSPAGKDEKEFRPSLPFHVRTMGS